MEPSSQNGSYLRERSLPAYLPRSASLTAIDSRRHSRLFGSFYNNLNTILEPDRASRRVSTIEPLQGSCGESILNSFADDTEEDMQGQEYADGSLSDGSTRASYIPPVPRIPSIYGRQNAEWNQGRARGQLSGRRPVQRRPPVSYDRQRNGSIIPTPDPLHSSPTVAGSGITVSASFNNLSYLNRNVPRSVSGSQFSGTDRPSTHVSSNPSGISHRDSMAIRQPRPINNAERIVPPVTHLQQEHIGPSFNTSTATIYIHGENKINNLTIVDDSKRPSPKHQRSMFGLRKSSAFSSASSQPSEFQKAIRSQTSSFQLRKTPSRVMNLDQVAHGAAPVTRDSQITTEAPAHSVVPAFQNAGLENAQPTAKRQRSRFQLRKMPTEMSPQTVFDKKGHHTELEYVNSIEESIISKDFKSKVPTTNESLPKRQISFGEEPLKSTPKASRSLFGLRKTPTAIIPSSTTPSVNYQGQGNNRFIASPRQYRSAMNLQPTSPSRIPTPVVENRGRYFSTPNLPSQKKENIHPHRLLGPISPSRTQGPAPKAIPKARTLGMISTLTSSFSRSTTNLTNASNSSAASLARTAEPTTSISNASATAPQSSFTPNIQHITEAQHSTWWCGRFMSVNDRFHGEMLEDTMNDPETFRSFQDNTRCTAPKVPDHDPKKAEEQEMYEPPTTGIQLIRDDEDRRVLRVFAHLKSLCVTDEARKSFFDFQQTYARMHTNANWLPAGGTLEDKPPGWVSRMTNVMSRRSEKGGNQTAMGRRTGLGVSVFGNKRSQTTAKARGNLN